MDTGDLTQAEIYQILLERKFPDIDVRYRNRMDLYLISDKAKTKLKIGVSHFPEERLKGLSTKECPLELLLVGYGLGRYERLLHLSFQELSLGKEWFIYSEEIIKEFKKII